jgi:hypothetical protein
MIGNNTLGVMDSACDTLNRIKWLERSLRQLLEERNNNQVAVDNFLAELAEKRLLLSNTLRTLSSSLKEDFK